MTAPVNVFENAFKTPGTEIQNHFEAAKHLLHVGMDGQLGIFIEEFLAKSKEFKSLRSSMPSKTPKSIAGYQRSLKSCDMNSVAKEIDKFGILLVEGTCLFHGGFWSPTWGSEIKLDRPFSTSFCPQVALRNAEWAGKAYDAGEVHLLILNVIRPSTKAFVFRRKGTNLGHESEVLFSSGASLVLRSKTKICDYRVGKVVNGAQMHHKDVPAYVLEIDIS